MGILKTLIAIVLLSVAIFLISTILPVAGVAISFLVLIALLVSSVRPFQRFGLTRGSSVALLAFSGLPSVFFALALVGSQFDASMDKLRVKDPDAYLDKLRTTNDSKWLDELKALRPQLYEKEIAERQAAEEAAQKEKEKIEAEAKVAARKEACSKDNSIEAFINSQQYVEKQLRAPATAEFPTLDFSVRDLGDCKYRVIAYVDAQNGFGALIRTNYSAIMVLQPETDSWTLEELLIE